METPPRPELNNDHRELLRKVAKFRLSQLPDLGLDASDLVQETMFQAHKQIHTYAGTTDEKFRGWLRKILYHLLIGKIRAAGRKPNVQSFKANVDESVRLLEKLIETEETPPPIRVSRAEDYDHLHQAVSSLPEDQREVVRLRIVTGLSFKSVAEVTGRTTKSVVGLYGRGLKTLKNRLSDHFEESP